MARFARRNGAYILNNPSARLRPAVVLSCRGGEETALNVTRALGQRGVPIIVVSEDPQRPAAAVSRYCVAHHVADAFSSRPQALYQVLRAIGEAHGPGVPVFPTADPDLEALNGLNADTAPGVVSTLAGAELVRSLMDKRAFTALARRHGLPVPATWEPQDRAGLLALSTEARFPLIAKPAYPFNWPEGLVRAFRGRKARVLAGPADLLALGEELDGDAPDILLQACVVGPDDEHYDVHAYLDRSGAARAVFTGRKWRIYPPHAGSGAYIESVDELALEQATLSMLRRIGFSGIANVNYKRDARTGEFVLLEINARVSQWSIFPSKLGVNLPWLVYCDICGIPVENVPRAPSGRYFSDFFNDVRAARTYCTLGEWSWARCLASWARVDVWQVLDLADPVPWAHLTGRRAKHLLARSKRPV